ncbi:MAG: hypothetical protein IKT42_07655 [Clostridia bacterium]|nr:hypothetical protein [Clostridia bacterium]
MSYGIEKIFENYICDPEVYNYAYENCKPYRMYINTLPEETMKKIRKVHSAASLSNGAHNVRKGLFHMGTFGLSFVAEKAFCKSKKQKVKELVDSKEFYDLFEQLYNGAL